MNKPIADAPLKMQFVLADERLRSGVGIADVENELIQNGADPATAHLVVATTVAGLRSAASTKMIVGGLAIAGGLLWTILSYRAAAAGGTYVIAWGAILFGGIHFFKGYASLAKLSPENGSDEPPHVRRPAVNRKVVLIGFPLAVLVVAMLAQC